MTDGDRTLRRHYIVAVGICSHEFAPIENATVKRKTIPDSYVKNVRFT